MLGKCEICGSELTIQNSESFAEHQQVHVRHVPGNCVQVLYSKLGAAQAEIDQLRALVKELEREVYREVSTGPIRDIESCARGRKGRPMSEDTSDGFADQPRDAHAAPSYDWKYLICPKGRPTWDDFAAEHGTWQTHPASNRDFDCTRVAEHIAEHVGADDDATFCLEDTRSNRFEVDVAKEEVVQYETTGYRDLGKSASPTPSKTQPAV